MRISYSIIIIFVFFVNPTNILAFNTDSPIDKFTEINWDKVISTMDEVIDKHNSDIDIVSIKDFIVDLKNNNKWSDASRVHDILIQKEKMIKEDVNLLFVRCVINFYEMNLSTARACFTDYAKIGNEKYEAYRYLGNIAMLSGPDIDTALSWYRKASEVDKYNLGNYLLINLILLKEKRITDAVDLLAQAISLNPSNELLHYNQTLNFLLLKNTTEALNHAKISVELNPIAKNFLLLGASHMQEKNFESAIIAFKKGLEKTPDSEKLLISLCSAYFENGQCAKAHVIFDKVNFSNSATKNKMENLLLGCEK